MPRLDGFDGAHYQTDYGEPNLVQTLLAGLWWIAWKVSQSDQYLDPTFPRIRSSWGGFRMRGMYHWLSSTKDVGAQAANFMRGVGVVQRGEFVMLDAEEKGISVAKCLRWCELIEEITHRPVVIYTGLYVEGGTIWKSVVLRHSRYGIRPFIVAAYVSETNLKTRMWQTGSLPDYPYQAWQFSSNGPVPGIVGRCDMDQIDDVPSFLLACAIDDIEGEEPMKVFGNSETGEFGDIAWPTGGCSLFTFCDDGSFRGLGFEEWVLEGMPMGVGWPNDTIRSIPRYRPPVTEIPPVVIPPITVPPLTGHIVADLGDKGHITGSVG